ncbi:hypothetical protein D3C80_1537130 [compost metagenome]
MPLQHVIQPDDFHPVRLFCRCRFSVYRGNRRLHRIGPECPALQGLAHQLAALVNALPVPQAAVLLFQHHQVALGIGSRLLPGRLQQHQGQQADSLRIRQQLHQQPRQANGFIAQLLLQQ